MVRYVWQCKVWCGARFWVINVKKYYILPCKNVWMALWVICASPVMHDALLCWVLGCAGRRRIHTLIKCISHMLKYLSISHAAGSRALCISPRTDHTTMRNMCSQNVRHLTRTALHRAVFQILSIAFSVRVHLLYCSVKSSFDQITLGLCVLWFNSVVKPLMCKCLQSKSVR